MSISKQDLALIDALTLEFRKQLVNGTKSTDEAQKFLRPPMLETPAETNDKPILITRLLCPASNAR